MENIKDKVSNTLSREEILSGDWIEDLSYIDEDLKIPTRSELVKSAPGADFILGEANRIASKVEEDGIASLTPEERLYYDYYLVINAYKKNAKGEATKVNAGNISDLIISRNTLFVLNQDVYIYDPEDGTYKIDQEGKLVKKMIRSALDREFIDAKTIKGIYDLILDTLEISLDISEINDRPDHWIHFANGYYDYKTGAIYPHDPKYHDINVIPWEFNPSEYPANVKLSTRGKGLIAERVEDPLLFNSWLNEALPDPDDQKMLLQYIGYSMTLSTSAQKFLMICGTGGTGKSTLLKVIETILGKSNISSVSLQGLQGQFSTVQLFLKQANICADIPLTALSEVDTIKKLTGEDTISADRKFKSAICFRSYARLFFSANDIPLNLSDRSNAFYRRMLIVKMDHTPDEIDPALSKKLHAEIQNIITRVIEEITISGGEIEISDNCKDLVKVAYKNSDSVEAFIDDRLEIGDTFRVNRRALYSDYVNYCDNEGRKPLNANGLYKALEAKGYKQIKGSSRDFVGLKITNVIQLSANVI